MSGVVKLSGAACFRQRRIQGGDIVIMEETARMAMFALVPAPLGGETSGTERFALTRRDDVIC